MRRLSPVRTACLMCSLAVLAAWGTGVRVNLTPSMPRGIYSIESRDPERGSLVTLCAPRNWGVLARERGYLHVGLCPGHVQPLLKRVVGLPGDEISLSSPGVTVNGTLLEHSVIRQADNKGNSLPTVLRAGRIPAGMALVLAPCPKSFDGRYFGLVPLSELRRVNFLWGNPFEKGSDEEPGLRPVPRRGR